MHSVNTRRIMVWIVLGVLTMSGLRYWQHLQLVRPETQESAQNEAPWNTNVHIVQQPAQELGKEQIDTLSTSQSLPIKARQKISPPVNSAPSNPSTKNPKPLGFAPIPIPKDSKSFNALADTLLSDLGALSDENPEGLMQAAVKLETIAEAVIASEDLRQDGIRFYSRCSESREFQPQVRAVCLSNLNELAPDEAAALAGHIDDPSVVEMAVDDDY